MYRNNVLFIIIALILAIGCSSSDSDSGSNPSSPTELSVSVVNLSFSAADNTLSFLITNDGGSPLVWEIANSSVWMACSPSSRTTDAGSNSEIEVTVDRVSM